MRIKHRNAVIKDSNVCNGVVKRFPSNKVMKQKHAYSRKLIFTAVSIRLPSTTIIQIINENGLQNATLLLAVTQPRKDL